MFNVLTSMKFFKHYLIGKVFALWKGNVRFKMYNRTRQNLARNLIQTRPAFLQSFMDIQKNLYEMNINKTYTVGAQGMPQLPNKADLPAITDLPDSKETFLEAYMEPSLLHISSMELMIDNVVAQMVLLK